MQHIYSLLPDGKIQDLLMTKAFMLTSVCSCVVAILGIPPPFLVLDADGLPQPYLLNTTENHRAPLPFFFDFPLSLFNRKPDWNHYWN